MVVLVILLTLTAITGCDQDKYADVREILAQHADVMDAYITGLEKAAGPADRATVINAYTDGMEKLIPRLKAFQETYPGLVQ